MSDATERYPVAGTERLFVISFGEPDPVDCSVAKIAALLGLGVSFGRLSPEVPGTSGSVIESLPREASVAVSATTLGMLAKREEEFDAWLAALATRASQIFVHGFEPSPVHDKLLRALTDGRLCGVRPVGGSGEEVTVAADAPEVCKHLRGLAFGEAAPAFDGAFLEASSETNLTTVMRAGPLPFLLWGRIRSCRLILVACREVADIEVRLSPHENAVPYFSRLVPAIIALRWAAGQYAWHNARPRASFILDDPLLKETYGCLNYRALTEEMRPHKFAATIGFIPWNFRRSQPAVAALFKEPRRRLSLCVHGCDHTAGEFGSREFDVLLQRSQEALRRMTLHSHQSGVPFDDVMVFPQGVFSAEALRALQCAGFSAAVNTTPWPAGLLDPPYQLKDLLEVAVTRFGNFPLFLRQYPSSLPQLAFDLFLGKPAILVQHHAYFRGGYGALAEFVQHINGLEEGLEWGSIGEVCSTASQQRVGADGAINVSFFTDRFRIQNSCGRARKYVLHRSWASGVALNSVTADGGPANFEPVAGGIRIALDVGPGSLCEVRFNRPRLAATSSRLQGGFAASSKTLVRRRLCEFRDQYIETSPILARLYSSARGSFFGRGRAGAEEPMRTNSFLGRAARTAPVT